MAKKLEAEKELTAAASMTLTKRLEEAAKTGDCEVIKEEINGGRCHVNSRVSFRSIFISISQWL
jgi:predicted chitinase